MKNPMIQKNLGRGRQMPLLNFVRPRDLIKSSLFCTTNWISPTYWLQKLRSKESSIYLHLCTLL